MDQEYLKTVFQVLTNNPTAQNLDFLIEAYAKVGYLVSQAKQEADLARTVRKHEEANEFLKAKSSTVDGKPISDGLAERMAIIATFTLRKAEIEADAKALKVTNLLDALRECLWSIRHLGKYDSSSVTIG